MLGGCEWHPDSAGYVTLKEALANLGAGCSLPDNIKGFASHVVVKDKHGHELDGDFDPHGRHGCNHRDSPEWKAEHMSKKQHKHQKSQQEAAPMSDILLPTPENTNIAPPLVLLANNETPPPASTIPSVGVDQAVAQVKQLLPAGADASPALLIGGAATLAVIGGAIKFGPQMLKARAEKAEREHEEKMKQLEIEQQKADQQKQDEQHGKCSVERAALEVRLAEVQSSLCDAAAKIEQLAEKLEAVNQPENAAAPDIDVSSLEQRIHKLEEAVKPPKPAKAKPAKGRK